MTRLTYVVISPVKDEERHIEKTIHSMIAQNVKPLRWLIVDDGSSDRTPEMIQKYLPSNPFIQLLRNSGSGPRQPGSGVIRAFNRGFSEIKDTAFDLIVKLDCDLQFEPDYFEKLISRFEENPKLGIASGVYAEAIKGERKIVSMPSYHAAGACKVVRAKCFAEIGGFIAAKGWDTVDEIRAMARGWTTTHFSELRMEHLKPEGSGIGYLRTNMMLGEIYRLTGGSKMFFALKLISRAFKNPILLGSIAMCAGYGLAVLKRKPLLVTAEEGKNYQRVLENRIWSMFKRN